MSDEIKRENPERESNSSRYQAEFLFNRGILKKAGERLDKAKEDLDRGATDQVEEHLKRVHETFLQSIVAPSSKLTDGENDLYINLKRRKYIVHTSGMVGTMILDDRNEERLKKLEHKVYGIEDRQG